MFSAPSRPPTPYTLTALGEEIAGGDPYAASPGRHGWMMRLVSCWPEASAAHGLIEPYKMGHSLPRQPATFPPRPKPRRPSASSLFAGAPPEAPTIPPTIPAFAAAAEEAAAASREARVPPPQRVLERAPDALGKDTDAWRLLTPPEKQAAESLGFTEWLWDNGLTPEACARPWSRLEPHMRRPCWAMCRPTGMTRSPTTRGLRSPMCSRCRWRCRAAKDGPLHTPGCPAVC